MRPVTSGDLDALTCTVVITRCQGVLELVGDANDVTGQRRG